jgi:hypothetical protein
MAASGGKSTAHDAAVSNEPAGEPASVVDDAAAAVEAAERKVAKQRDHLAGAEQALEQARQEHEDAQANATSDDEED